MPMNRVQFQRGLSMPEFLSQYGTDAQCEAALTRARWPSGFACPRCSGPSSCSFRREGRLYWQCASCRHQCSVISGTIFEATKLPLTLWFLAMHLLTQAKNNVSALELKRHLGVSYPTAWLVKHKLMEVMRLREQSRQLTGRVEIDDAYLGGESTGGKIGRGAAKKVPFIAAVQTTEAGKPVLACFAQAPFTKQAVDAFVATSLVRPLTVVSDGLHCFLAAEDHGVHERHITGSGKAAVKLPQFQAVNTVLSNLKTAMTGTYHAVKFQKYAHRYLAEVQYRFNRRFDLRSILKRLVRIAATAEPRTRDFIREAEVGC